MAVTMVGLLRRSVAFKNVKSGLYINVQDDGGDHSPLGTCASKIPFASRWTPHIRPDGKWSFDSHTGHWMNVKKDGAEHPILWTPWTRSSNLKRINMWRSSGYKNDDVETVLADEASTRPAKVKRERTLAAKKLVAERAARVARRAQREAQRASAERQRRNPSCFTALTNGKQCAPKSRLVAVLVSNHINIRMVFGDIALVASESEQRSRVQRI